MEKLLNYFKEISNIPRETYHVEKISNYLIEFAKERNLEYYTDNYHNVIIIKEANENYKDIPSVILQAHMDMVCQKEDDSNHNFDTDPIEIIEEAGLLKANKTTLGADDGVGVAMILSILDSNYPLGKIEAVFTANEEVGMDGAINLDTSNLDSKYLINLDSEDEGVLTAGCAGGISLEVKIKIKRESKSNKTITINISNLKGGHSGVDINKNRVNAITFISKILKDEEIKLIEINGGKVDNAIPSDVSIKILVDKDYNSVNLENKIKQELIDLKEENSKVELIEENNTYEVITNTKDIINYLNNTPNGVLSYEESLDNVVRTSTNLGIIKTTNDEIIIRHLIRSSNEKELMEVVSKIKENANSVNSIVKEENPYPGWQYDENSKLRKLMEDIYIKQTNKELIIEVIHAGLECGILKSKMPNLDCVSIGPTIKDVHTPNETVEIKSIERVYNYLKEVLAHINEIN